MMSLDWRLMTPSSGPEDKLNLQETQSEQETQTDLVTGTDLQLPHHRHGQDDDGSVSSNIQSRNGDVCGIEVAAFAARNGLVPVVGEGSAETGSDRKGHDHPRDAVAHDTEACMIF
jgi:hypothetical protein